MLDDVLGKYKNGMFELFNIIAHNIDQAAQIKIPTCTSKSPPLGTLWKRGFGEQIIKESLVELDRRIENGRVTGIRFT